MFWDGPSNVTELLIVINGVFISFCRSRVYYDSSCWVSIKMSYWNTTAVKLLFLLVMLVMFYLEVIQYNQLVYSLHFW